MNKDLEQIKDIVIETLKSQTSIFNSPIKFELDIHYDNIPVIDSFTGKHTNILKPRLVLKIEKNN